MTDRTVLVADDDRAIRTVISHALVRAGFRVRATGEAATLWGWISAGEGDLVVTDVVMPDGSGLDLMPRIKSLRPELPIVVMSARNTLLTAVQAAERGAYEYLPKPFYINQLSSIVKIALSFDRSNEDSSDGPARDLTEPSPLIGRSTAMQALFRQIARLTRTDLTVLITGESGTGKELVAHALHDFGKRRRGPFVALNMAAIPRELIESELFGHERGAFTGATRRWAGRFHEAARGTMFLDEIGDMPLEAQTRLLRVLQHGDYRAVGGDEVHRIDARIIAATNRNLRGLVDRGAFREDLYYRLNVVPLHVPPLRDRISDIGELVEHFAACAAEEGLPLKAVRQRCVSRPPGALVARQRARAGESRASHGGALRGADDRCRGHWLGAGSGRREGFGREESGDSLVDTVEKQLSRYFALHGAGLPPDGLYSRVLHEIERPLIILSLAATGGNQVKAARLLGLNRNTLRKKLRDLRIPAGRDP